MTIEFKIGNITFNREDLPILKKAVKSLEEQIEFSKEIGDWEKSRDKELEKEEDIFQKYLNR